MGACNRFPSLRLQRKICLLRPESMLKMRKQVKFQKSMKLRILPLILLSLFAITRNSHAQGTAFTYNGKLNAGGGPANGSYDLSFTLFPASSGGPQAAAPATNTATAVSNGLFTVTLDFGTGVFNGTS